MLDEYFKCEPYRCRMRRIHCLRSYERVREADLATPGGLKVHDYLFISRGHCLGCQTGADLAARVRREEVGDGYKTRTF